jgi:pilus assembly protein CpaF
VSANGIATGAPARRLLHGKLLERVDMRALEGLSRAERRLRIREHALGLMRDDGHILPRESLAKLVNEVSDEVVGLGPIEFLLKDPDVTEVMVNGADDVYVERKGRIERVQDGLFEGEEAVLHVIERIVAPLGLRVDESSPYADARLPDGSRVQTRRRRDPPYSPGGPSHGGGWFSLPHHLSRRHPPSTCVRRPPRTIVGPSAGTARGRRKGDP